MKCPACTAPLDAFKLKEGPEVDVCSFCGGAWYDKGEVRFPWLVKAPKPAQRVCPRCDVRLYAGKYGEGGPEIDFCNNCGGLWFDQGELQRIQKIAANAGPAAAPRRAPVQPRKKPPPPPKKPPPKPRAEPSLSGAAAAAAVGGFIAPVAGGAPSPAGGGAKPESSRPSPGGAAGSQPAQAYTPRAYTPGDAKPMGRAAHKPPPYSPWIEYWDEFLLYNPEHGYAWLIRENDHYNLVRTTKLRSGRDVFMMNQKSQILLAGQHFTVFDDGKAVLDEAEGETPWVAKPGDTVDAVDCINPPKIYTVERSKNEMEHFIGEYVEPEEVWEGFKLPGKPPQRYTVDACQPFLEKGSTAQCKWWSLLFALVFGAGLAWTFMSGAGKQVFTENFTSPPEGKTVESQTFTVGRKDTICRVDVNTSVDNQWMWLGFDIIDENGNPSGEFSTQTSYYHGTDRQGYSWNEGKKSASAMFRVADPGTYRLRISAQNGRAETPESLSIPFGLALYEDYRPRRFFLISFLIAAMIAWSLFHARYNFEARRWAPVLEDEDDDDD